MRRLTTAPSLLLAIVAIVAIIALPAHVASAAAVKSYAASNYALQLGNEQFIVRSVDGGAMRGEVVTEPDGNKHIGAVVAEPIKLQIPHDALTQYISSALDNSAKSQPQSGSILFLDFDYKTKATREFHDALLTEITFPTLDARAKEPASINIVLQPSRTSVLAGDNAVASGGMKNTVQRKALASNFRVKLGEMPTQRVTKVDAITATRKVASVNPGAEDRGMDTKTAGNWQVSNTVLTIPQVDALPFEKWAEDTLGRAHTRGNAEGGGEGSEKSMTIDMLDPSLQNVLMTINCTGVGLVSVKPEPAQAGSEQAANVRVELYVEKVALTVPKGGSAAATPAGGDTAAPAPAAPAAAGSTQAPPPPGGAAAGTSGTSAAAPGAPAAASSSGDSATIVAPPPAAAARKKRPAAPTLTPQPAPTPAPAPTAKPAPKEPAAAPDQPAPAPAPVRRTTPRG